MTSNVTSGRKPLDATQTGLYNVFYGVQLRGAFKLLMFNKMRINNNFKSESTTTNLKISDVIFGVT